MGNRERVLDTCSECRWFTESSFTNGWRGICQRLSTMHLWRNPESRACNKGKPRDEDAGSTPASPDNDGE